MSLIICLFFTLRFNLSCYKENWEHPGGAFALYRTRHWKRTVKLSARREFTLSEMKNSELPTMWEDTWYWFLAWHGFLCSTTVPTCCPGENNKSHNHCNLWQLQLSRLLSSQFSGHKQTFESLSSIIGWLPIEKVEQRYINNRNGGQTRISHPACCSLSLATQIIWKIFICFTLLKRKLAPDGLCLSQHRDRWTWGYKMWPRVQLSPRAASLGCWWTLQSWKWNYGLGLGTTIQIFSRH